MSRLTTTERMFHDLSQRLAAERRREQDEQDERCRRWAEQEARLDAPLTRREVLDAIESVASEYQGYYDSHLIRDLLQKLAEALR